MQNYKFVNSSSNKQMVLFFRLQIVANIEKTVLREIIQDSEFYSTEDFPSIFYANLDAYLEAYITRNPPSAIYTEARAKEIYNRLLLFQIVTEDILRTTVYQNFLEYVVARLDIILESKL